MQAKGKQDLREISHLFLSSVRQRQMGTANPPRRIAPSQRTDPPVDLTPEELASVAMTEPPARQASVPAETASFLLGAHLNGSFGRRASEYAMYRACSGDRVGLIELDAHRFDLTLFDPEAQGHRHAVESKTNFDSVHASRILNHLAPRVDRWVITLPPPRLPVSRELLRHAHRIVLLSHCDTDGVVAAYRALKGVADMLRRSARQTPPRLALALIEPADPPQAAAVFEKISGVSLQFLSWPIEWEATLGGRPLLLPEPLLRATVVAGDSSDSPHWRVLLDFLQGATEFSQSEPASGGELQGTPTANPPPSRASSEPPGEPAASIPDPPAPASGEQSRPTLVDPVVDQRAGQEDEILDLGDGDDACGVLSAVLTHSRQGWIECPLRPPACPEARLAVSRDRRLTLLAVATRGLSDLRAIGRAYHWLCENRALVAMALPQLAIDAHQLPRLELLVDHADASADTLQPLLHAGHVAVTAYRKVRWSGRRGVLLGAA
ncbi:MAG: hypothetical protein NZ561_04055 [Phycisphaerae bacterium]|nr:hypothetical protein [Phycisphaerae bacterium]